MDAVGTIIPCLYTVKIKIRRSEASVYFRRFWRNDSLDEFSTVRFPTSQAKKPLLLQYIHQGYFLFLHFFDS